MRLARLLWLILATGVSGTLAAAPGDLDLVFVIDATGSMSHEIQEVKQRVREISNALAAERPGRRIRLGMVAYRDRGDEFLTRVSPLGADVETSFAFLSTLSADGGGDGPEDVLSGLAAALHEMRWDPADTTDREMFLIGDAPPHLDYAEGPSVDEIVEEALERRIVLHAIGCRSLPSAGVHFFRKVAYATEGVYRHIGRLAVSGTGAASPTDGVADAVLTTLEREPPPERGEPIQARLVDRVEPLDVPLVELQSSLARDGLTCTLRIALPDGTWLSRDPLPVLARDGLHVPLSLSDGPGETRVYDLDPCPPPSTVVHVELEVD